MTVQQLMLELVKCSPDMIVCVEDYSEQYDPAEVCGVDIQKGLAFINTKNEDGLDDIVLIFTHMLR